MKKMLRSWDLENLEGESFLTVYRFGDKDVDHHFCRICGICPFHTVAKIPPTCTGPARPGDYRINLGAQFARRVDPKAQVCPQVLISLTTGAGDVSGLTINYRENLIGAGVDAGFVLYEKGDARIIPNASLGLLGGRIKYTYSTGTKRTQDADAYGLLTTGIGFGLNKQLTISPTVTVPLGRGGASTLYGVTFSIGKVQED